jgi:hypothetical protein
MCYLKVILFIFFVALATQTFCQDADMKNFILPQISKHVDSEKLVYTERISEWAYQLSKENMNKTLFVGDATATKELRFSKKEKEFILSQIKLCTRPYWPDSFFNYSKRIKLDSVSQYFKTKLDAKRRIFPLIDSPGYSRAFWLALIRELNRRDWVFSFSKPIYLRNNTLALLYLQAVCGFGCGYEELVLYRKSGGEWKKWTYVFQGAY